MQHGNDAWKLSGYGRFLAMIGTSTIMIYGLMYLNTYAARHVFFSQTRMWMALYMGGRMMGAMMLVMLLIVVFLIASIVYFVKCTQAHNRNATGMTKETRHDDS